ncbi:MAG: efflux RND transporter periplasmic adaptor subunit [Alphaproteobacteria bacterium]|nr:efflux RND transporter periplasmic adaptor subunit [Alphaproteobacteria bacterium]
MTSNNRVFKAVGTGRARYSVGVFPSVAEEVTEVLFEAEQKVVKGDVLVKLDDRQEQLALKLAEVELNDAQSLLERYEQAVKEGAVPESEVDAARADFEGAEVALDQAKLAMEDRLITAPFEGHVGIPNIDPGDRVGTDTLISWLDARETLYVDFEVPEALAGALKKAQAERQEITATTPAYLSLTFKGKITAQESRVDPERRTLLARASIDNKDDLLRPGMSFETVWEIPGEDYATVPEISVQWERGGSYVWVIRDNKAEKVSAQVIARKAGRVLLQGELDADDDVVIEGLQRLRPNQDVEVLGSAE